MTGLSLSHFRIDTELGRGGMGVVYRAFDTKLDRTVALKVLPSSALSTADDRARFFREAKAAASLHHPNIATVFGIDEAVPLDDTGHPVAGQAEPRLFIAMECIEGETLRQRIEKGPLKLEEAVSIASQIAEALKAAHGKEIVHRDIKSANVMLTPEGTAKVLDFGLAKTQASTMLTQLGSTLGTVAYMSPEQARGEQVDGRSDLYSLGTVFYEMIAGRLPFAAEYEQAIVYSILNEAPDSLTGLRTGIPLRLEWVVEKLLAKDAEHRYQSAADLIADLKSLDLSTSRVSQKSGSREAVKSTVSRERLPYWAGIFLALAFGVVGTWMALGVLDSAERAPGPVRTLDWLVEGAEAISAIPPDGSLVVASISDGTYRAFDTEEGRLSDADLDVRHAWRHEFSSDGEWLLNSGGPGAPGVARLRLSDNRSVTVLNEGMGATWTPSGAILYTSNQDSSLWRVDVDGENAVLVASKDYDRNHIGLYLPVVLPSGDYAVAHGWSGESRDVVLVDLRAGTYEVLIPEAACAEYLPSGHLLYLDGGDTRGEVMVRPFDAGKGQFTGDETPAGLGVQTCWSFAMGVDGTLVHPVSREITRSYYWIDHDGNDLGAIPDLMTGALESEQPLEIERPRLSPSGDRIAVGVRSAEGADIYLHDLENETSIRLTFSDVSGYPSWSPDGRWIYFSGVRDGEPRILRKPADLSGTEDSTAIGHIGLDPSLSTDGSQLAYYDLEQGQLIVQDVTDPSIAVGLGGDDNYDPAFSVDGRYLAAESVEGIVVFEVGGSSYIQISADQTYLADPEWSADGKYLYFRTVDRLQRAPVQTFPRFTLGRTETIKNLGGEFQFSLHPNGSRILILGPDNPTFEAPRFRIAFNWLGKVKRMAPTWDSDE